MGTATGEEVEEGVPKELLAVGLLSRMVSGGVIAERFVDDWRVVDAGNRISMKETTFGNFSRNRPQREGMSLFTSLGVLRVLEGQAAGAPGLPLCIELSGGLPDAVAGAVACPFRTNSSISVRTAPEATGGRSSISDTSSDLFPLVSLLIAVLCGPVLVQIASRTKNSISSSDTVVTSPKINSDASHAKRPHLKQLTTTTSPATSRAAHD